METPFPIQVTFNGVSRNPRVEQLVHGHVEHLAKFHPRIHGCRVVIRQAEGHSHAGGYHVQLRVAIPGNDVVIGHQHGEPNEDMGVAVGDAFRAAERMLEERAAAQAERSRGSSGRRASER